MKRWQLIEAFQLGGPGSGHFGHKGIPGQRGGSVPSKGSWLPSMSSDSAQKWAAGTVYANREFYHHTNTTAAQKIAKEGFKVSDGNYGTGIYLTPNPEGVKSHRFADTPITVKVRSENSLVVGGSRELNDWWDKNDPGNPRELHEVLKSQGYDTVWIERGKLDPFLLVLDPHNVTVVADDILFSPKDSK